MRNVWFKRWIKEKMAYDSDFIHAGKFHKWGDAYEEFESGPGNFTVALVELPDGTIEEVQPKNIKFIDDDKRESILNRNIEDIDFTVRVHIILRLHNVRTVRDLMKTKVSELMTYKNFGKKSLTEVIEKLRDFEITMRNGRFVWDDNND